MAQTLIEMHGRNSHKSQHFNKTLCNWNSHREPTEDSHTFMRLSYRDSCTPQSLLMLLKCYRRLTESSRGTKSHRMHGRNSHRIPHTKSYRQSPIETLIEIPQSNSHRNSHSESLIESLIEILTVKALLSVMQGLKGYIETLIEFHSETLIDRTSHSQTLIETLTLKLS